MGPMSNKVPPVVRITGSGVHKPSVNLYIELLELILNQESKREDTKLVLAIKIMGSRVVSKCTARAGGMLTLQNI
jgi:hypothetical protein